MMVERIGANRQVRWVEVIKTEKEAIVDCVKYINSIDMKVVKW
jgi:hypothetical protein